MSDGGDEGELEDGVNGGDFVGKEVEFVGGEFLGNVFINFENERGG